MRRFLASFVVAALAVGAGAPGAHAKDSLVVGASLFTDSIAPTGGAYITLSLCYQTWDPLIARDSDDKLIPALAEKWEAISPTQWRFHLRKGVKFHDGTPFTAADAKFTIDYVIDPKTVYARKTRIAGVVGTEVVDDYTIDIKTAKPAPLLLRGLADIPIESKAHTEKVGFAEAHKKPMGTGPFKFVEWVAGDHYDLIANEAYWDGAPAVKKLRIRAIPEGATRVASLVAGETDIIEEIPVDLLPSVEKRKNLKVDAVESSVSLVQTFDTRKPPFNDVRVRIALDYAIDKQTLLKQMLGGYGSVLDGQLVTKSTFGYNPNIKSRPYDPAKAKALLAEAGYPKDFQNKINTLSGRYLSDVDIANAVAGMMTEAGVKTSVNVVEGGVWSQLDRSRDQGPMYQVGWFSVGDADFNTVWYTEVGKRNYWSNAEFDKLWAEARSTLDEAARLKAYNRMMEIMHEEMPSIFLFGLPRISGRSDKVSGWKPSRDSLLRLSKVSVK
ncbi:ABC transporter substrate-binding protein [Reyranella sp.]|uniref:ABC transporter substrate-binding protein n=1 Tax=Reyranella sp. TaxID=1929291 RepID=UPI003BA8C7F2